MTETQPESRYQVRAVGRAIDLLVAIGEGAAPKGLSGLAREVDLPPSTTFRLLETLRSRDIVRASRDGYVIGAKTFELGSAFLRTVSIWSHAGELAEHLAVTAGETASIGVLDDDQVLYIAITHGQRELGIQSVAGTRHPTHATALGKVLLAGLPIDEALASLHRRPPERLTEKTVTELTDIRRELARVASQGYAVDDEERLPGVICIGAPIRDHTGDVVAAISVSGPTFRVREASVETVVAQVKAVAEKASRQLGAPLLGQGVA